MAKNNSNRSSTGWKPVDIAGKLGVRKPTVKRAVNDAAVVAVAVGTLAAASGIRAYREVGGKDLVVGSGKMSADVRWPIGLIALGGSMYVNPKYSAYIQAGAAGLIGSWAVEKAENFADKRAKAVKDVAGPTAAGVVVGDVDESGKLTSAERKQLRVERKLARARQRLRKLAAAADNTNKILIASPAAAPSRRQIGADPFIANKRVSVAEYARQLN